MSLVVTDAIVLHAFDYRETSRIIRLATRDAGVRSVLARGARRSRNRFGAALDLFAEGSAQIVLHPTRDLHTLAAFDVTRPRPALAERWPRFAAASALVEIALRFGSEDAHTLLFDGLSGALDRLGAAEGAHVATEGLAGAWLLVAELGFAPLLDTCASCDTPIAPALPARFAHRAGGVLCATCAVGHHGVRELPPAARATIGAWLAGDVPPPGDDASVRAHQRLLREFLREHLGDDRPLRAFAVWERDDWNPA